MSVSDKQTIPSNTQRVNLLVTTDDDHRVTLKPLEGHKDCQTDYINGSYVDVSPYLYPAHANVTEHVLVLFRDTPSQANSSPHKVWRNIQFLHSTRLLVHLCVLSRLNNLTTESISPAYLLPLTLSILPPGPLPVTVVDFWRLVWQERAPTIVMITNLVEGTKIKCHQYWPDKDSARFGPFEVSLIDQQTLADYTVRTLIVQV